MPFEVFPIFPNRMLVLYATYIRNFDIWTFLRQGSWDFGVVVTILTTSVLFYAIKYLSIVLTIKG